MKLLHRMLITGFLPVFLFSMLFFVLILEIGDVFGNISRYLAQDVSIIDILRVSLLYVPKCISFALPISLLFSISYTLGTLYSQNELISVLGSGFPFYRFVMPFIFIGILLSAGSFWFNENIVIQTFQDKNALSRSLLKQTVSFSNTNIAVVSTQGRIMYQADYYNDNTQSLTGLVIVERDEAGTFVKRIDAETAKWTGSNWLLSRTRTFEWGQDGYLKETYLDSFSDPLLNESPGTFRKNVKNIDEIRVTEARDWIISLRLAGLPFRDALTDFYKRFALAFTPLIVALLSSAIGGWLKKNILLMSLLLSLLISIGYFVSQMVLVILAKQGFLSPEVGAWGSFFIFSLIGVVLFRTART